MGLFPKIKKMKTLKKIKQNPGDVQLVKGPLFDIRDKRLELSNDGIHWYVANPIYIGDEGYLSAKYARFTK